MHARLEDVQFRLAHGALEAQQQAVVVGAGVVDAVRVADQRVEERAHFQELMPVAARARQARALDAEPQSPMAKPDLGDKALETGSIESRGGGAAEIVVDDQDLFLPPPQPAGAIRQSILKPRRLAVLLNLTHRRLADINHRLAFAMARPDLVRDPRIEAVQIHAHDPPPDRLPGAAGSARSQAPPVGGVARLVDPATAGGGPVSGSSRLTLQRARDRRARWPTRGVN